MGYSTYTRRLTLTATLAAVYVVFRAIPIDQLIGINGTITAAGMIAPIIGILLEPAYGIVAVFTGTMVASLLPWNPIKFAGLDFLPGALNVTLVSLTVRGRRTEATLMFLITIAIFIINPYTSIFVGSTLLSPPIPYLWMHLAALIVLVSPLTNHLANRLTSHHYARLIRPLVVLAFTGTMIEHLTGGILFATVVGKGALKFWPVIFLAYPIERTILVIGATLIGSTLLSLLRSTVVEKSLPTIKQAAASPIKYALKPDDR
ncbi:hypothetical protein AUI06_10875 [archaeon 13_2_20CM_2_52_21]|nr:MAG: hypothetical protein AUI06_10875 [archaeon 13_2_20CM_2_52_21]OLD08352.1 MAG: hypothetical protein AUI95_03425 [Crenarchaeota archaeon 13_1_40CM_3_52_4]OLD44661.1 MAG: hypothetical protein AUI51_01265 [archaeon 13_1_40CM_2_52_4]